MSQLVPEKQFSAIKTEVEKAIRDNFPVSTKKSEIKLHDVWVDDNKKSTDVRGQKDALMRGRSWNVPVYADLSLRRGGKEVDRKKVIVAHIPKITDRFGYIVDGNEYQTLNQFRLKSGVYHRRAANDLLLAEFNLANRDQFAKGRSFKVQVDPKDAIFYLKFENSHIPLYPLMKDLGVSDRVLERTWGKEIARKNRDKMPPDRALSNFYKAVNGKKPENIEEARGLLGDLLKKTKLLEETTKKTLGKGYKTVESGTILSATKNLLSMSRGERAGDDKTSLDFLSVHSAEDLIAGRIRDAAWKTRRKIINGLDRKRSVRSIVPTSEFDKQIKSFFHTSLVSQGEQTNPLEMLAGQRKTTIMGEQGGIKSIHAISEDSKLINPSHLGFLDPIHTPEGERTGISLTLPIGVSKKGNSLNSTFMDAKTGKKKALDPGEALTATVGFPDQYEFVGGKPKPRGKTVKATVNGKVVNVDPKKVDYIIPSARGIFSVSSNLIPFLQNNQGNRAMTAARQQEQAVPLDNREAPLVQVQTDGANTFEQVLGKYASRRSPVDGVIDRVKKDAIVIRKGKKKYEVQLYRNFPLQGQTLYDSTVKVKAGDRVKKGQLIADSSFTKDGTLALGTNLRTAYMPFKGYNFEDGIVISESAAKKLTSLHMYKKEIEADSEAVINRKKFLAEHPYSFKKDQISGIEDGGVIKVGAEVKEGDPLVLLLRKPSETKYRSDLKTFSRGRPDKYRDRSVVWDKPYPGIVTDVVRRGNKVSVFVKTKEPAQSGDKLVGRHGNKGIITKIVADSDMPYREGKGGKREHIEIALNPLGIPGRINIGQVLETAAGKVAEKKKGIYKVRNFAPGSDYLGQVKEDLKSAGLKDKETLINPETGKPFDQDILVGNQYTFKLRHQVQKKMSARSGGFGSPYNINHAPAGGAPHGGMSLGELGLYSMLAHGARENLHEMFAYKSTKNDDLWDALREGTPLPPPKTPFAYEKFLGYMNAMRVNVKKEGNHLVLSPFTEEQVKALSAGELQQPGLALRGKDLKPEKGGLFDEKVTGGVEGTRWSHFKLSEPMPNPLFEDAIKKVLGLTQKKYEDVVRGRTSYKGQTGGKALQSMLSDVDVSSERKKIESKIKDVRGETRNKLHSKLRILKALETNKSNATVYMMDSVPVLPPVFRPIIVREDGNLSTDDLNNLYKDIGAVNDSLKSNKKAGVPDAFMQDIRGELYDGLKALTGMGGSITRKGEYKGIIDIISGKTRKSFSGQPSGSPKHGFFQKSIIKRRQDFTARSTIVPEPRMGLDELGLPEGIAWKLYEPFVSRELIRANYKPLDAFDAISKKTKAAESALNKVIHERPILLKRDPALHKHNVMAFKPRLVKGKAIEIHPLVTAGYNADFDGDAMNVYLPITSKASKEAEGMYPSNNLFSPTTGAVQYTPGHEALLGLYLASKPGKRTRRSFKTESEARKEFKRGKIGYTDVVKVGGHETTIGRLDIESTLPKKMRETGRKKIGSMRIFDKGVTKQVLTDVAKNHPHMYGEVANKLKDIGNKHSYEVGYSVGLDDFAVINKGHRDKLINKANAQARKVARGRGSAEAKNSKIIDIFSKVDDDLDRLNTFHLKKFPTNISTMVDSGSRGSFSQLKQIISSPILVKDSKDRVVPYLIPKSYSEGMDVASYWTTMHGARKGTIQKVQGVRDPGYISKQIVNSSMNQVVTQKDCGTSQGIWMDVNDPDIVDRRLAKGIRTGGKRYRKNTVTTAKTLSSARKGRRDKLFVRSPLRCESAHGVCQSCMGTSSGGKDWDIGSNVGIISAQAIGEPSTQLSLNTFHTGGLAKGKGAKSQGTFKRLEQLLRMPKMLPNSAPLALGSGKVQKIEKAPQGGEYVTIGGKQHYVPASQERKVKLHQKVSKGDSLSDGVVDPKKLLVLKGLQSVQDYLTDEIRGVVNTAAPVRRRNIEVVVKALTNVTRVDDPGDHPDWVVGDMRPYSQVRAYNSKKGKKRVHHTPALKGVDILPLEMQEDWVARMNFNKLQTTLTQAAREGWRSNIHGFHPIPAATYAAEFGQKSKVKDWKGQY
tara:strand:- start:806 stop:6961 length:6156 start_codon:yes stop_codon:yes gene_type:complete